MIIKATLSDAAEINKLVNSAYRGEGSKKGWTTEADLLGGVRVDVPYIESLINSDTAELYLYQNEDNEIIGNVLLEPTENKMYLGMLCVSPTLQGGGVGKKLLYHGETVAKSLNIDTIEMTVISVREELIAWYERHGYKKTGETKPFTSGKGAFGKPKMEIEFVVLEKVI